MGYREQVPTSYKRPRYLHVWAMKTFEPHGNADWHVHLVAASAAAGRTKGTDFFATMAATSTEMYS